MLLFASRRTMVEAFAGGALAFRSCQIAIRFGMTRNCALEKAHCEARHDSWSVDLSAVAVSAPSDHACFRLCPCLLCSQLLQAWPAVAVWPPGTIGANEREQHARYQCLGFDGLVEPTVFGRIGIELFLEKLRQHNGDAHRILPGKWPEFQISHDATSR